MPRLQEKIPVPILNIDGNTFFKFFSVKITTDFQK